MHSAPYTLNCTYTSPLHHCTCHTSSSPSLDMKEWGAVLVAVRHRQGAVVHQIEGRRGAGGGAGGSTALQVCDVLLHLAHHGTVAHSTALRML